MYNGIYWDSSDDEYTLPRQGHLNVWYGNDVTIGGTARTIAELGACRT